ncbi:DUF4136 domain-containing protein [Ulvibacter antarcticus]|uniref:Uncharacterized protein DUF4136 n=1 Tax=Ulvibacter antarcticus TaxID=442714 RepID=A0A3L9YG78_9FLAO|nr:DUF4136 domain-containing protein [Ulvibacter antarcticus]RMA57115.1 uncharacterized protein DUF4136 [Ulvibacter antarcticus]
MKLLLILLFSILLVSCGASVAVDYDKEADFTHFKSYNFYNDIDSGLNDLDDKRIMKAIDSTLQTQGFSKSEIPDFLINFYASETLSNSRNTIGIGLGSGGGNVGVGVSGGIPIGGKVINQLLTIDLIDTSKGEELAWQAMIDGEMKEKATPQQQQTYYYKVIAQALKKFPPSAK